MKKSMCSILLLFLLLMPVIKADAMDYTLNEGKEIEAPYAGTEEDSYNYFKFVPAKNGYAEIKVKTSNGAPLTIDICDAEKQIEAENVVINNKKSVLHKVKKGVTYYIRTKGIEGQTHIISYKSNNFETLKYAKKYSYSFTNASLCSYENALILKFKAKESGNMNLMCNAGDNLDIQYLNGKKKLVSNVSLIKGHSLTGIGVNKGSTYYIKIWKPDYNKEGTITISNIKYQIEKTTFLKNATRGQAKTIQASGNKTEAVKQLLEAGKKNTSWYKIKLKKKKKITLTFESHLLQNNGDGIQLYICNAKGKELHKEAIVITEEAKASYKKKYKMEYPRKKITTGILPAGTYYVKIISNNKNTSGSYQLSWK